MHSEVAVILAAGRGTRMNSSSPKVLAKLRGRPIIEWVINAVRKAGIERILVVVGHKKEDVTMVLEGLGADWVEQPQQLGTGQALKVAGALLESYPDDVPENIIVLQGDCPLVKPNTISALKTRHCETRSDATLVTAYLDDPSDYGRVMRNEQGQVTRIVEELDATEEEAGTKEVNSGIYCFRLTPLLKALERLTPDNMKGEYYLTQVIEILNDMGGRVSAVVISDTNEVLGVNSQEDLKRVSMIAGDDKEESRYLSVFK